MFKIKFLIKGDISIFIISHLEKQCIIVFLLTNSALSDKNNGYMLTVKYYPYKIIPL